MGIVSLCPSLTELVFDLGLGAELVGVSDYCVRPAFGISTIEKVGGTKTPRIDRIIEMAPDIVLLNDEENRLEDARALANAGLTCHSSLPRNPTETAAMVRSIGDLLERPQKAEAIATRIEVEAGRLREATAGLPAVRFAYLIWRKPWMTVNSDTYAHSLLALAAGENVFGENATRYPEISTADLRSADPDVVLLGSEPFPFSTGHCRELAASTGLPLTRFRLADGEYLSWHGSRTAAGIRYAGDLLVAVRNRSS